MKSLLTDSEVNPRCDLTMLIKDQTNHLPLINRPHQFELQNTPTVLRLKRFHRILLHIPPKFTQLLQRYLQLA